VTTSPPDDRSPVLREDERTTALQRVQAAYTEGHISHEDMDSRLDRVLTATTQNEIELALAALPAAKPDTSATINAASGRLVRRGVWRLPRNLKVVSAFGRVKLDLSQAIIEYPQVDIELQVAHGRAKIIVPRNAIVDYDGLHTEWKDTRYRPARNARPGGPTIRITGAMGFGRLKIRHAR